MMLHTTIRPLLVATLFCLPLCATLSPEEGAAFDLDHTLEALQATEGTDEALDFTHDDATKDEVVVEKNDDSADSEQMPSVDNDNIDNKEPLSPSDESSSEPTLPADEHAPLADKKNNEQPQQEQKDKVPATWLQDLNNFSFLKDSCPVLLDKLSASVWFQLQTVGAMVVIPFMAYKTLVHLKQIFTDKEKQRGKHILRSFLYGTSGIITLNALIQYMQTLKGNETAQI